tara:strand:+ start:545 stop:790 length:246 start_codon:yes stop_codon:yes gene_type:complete
MSHHGEFRTISPPGVGEAIYLSKSENDLVKQIKSAGESFTNAGTSFSSEGSLSSGQSKGPRLDLFGECYVVSDYAWNCPVK